MEFDVSAYQLQDTATFTPKNAAGDDDLIGIDGAPVVFEIYSPGSPVGVKARHKVQRNEQLRMYRGIRGDLDKNDAESGDRELHTKLSEVTKSISPNFPMLPLTVYQNQRLIYITAQVNEFFGKYSNFSKGPSAS